MAYNNNNNNNNNTHKWVIFVMALSKDDSI